MSIPHGLTAANQPRRPLPVEIVLLAESDRQLLVPVFWRLLGELVAEILLDGVDGPWGETETSKNEILAS